MTKTILIIATILFAYALGRFVGVTAGYKDRMRDEYWSIHDHEEL